MDDERSNGIVQDVLVDDCVAMILVGLNEEQVVFVEFVADGVDRIAILLGSVSPWSLLLLLLLLLLLSSEFLLQLATDLLLELIED